MLGNLEEGGDRRQQVGDDLLDDRHERAAARQLHELFEVVCFMTVSDVVSRRIAVRHRRPPREKPGRRALPGPELELPFGLGDQHLEAADCRSRRRARRQELRVVRRVDQVVDEPAVQRHAVHRAEPGRVAAAGVALTSTSQLPDGGGKSPARPPASAATRRAASAAARETVTSAPLSASATATAACRPAGTEERRARAAEREPSGERREKPVDVRVRADPAAVADHDGVDRADAPRQRIDLVHVRHERHLERRGDAGAAQRDRAGEMTKSAASRRFERQIGGVEAERGEAGVVHDRRPGVDDRVANDAVERGIGPDPPEPEVAKQPRRRDLTGATPSPA